METVLLMAFVIVVLCAHLFISKIKGPLQNYIKLAAAISLLVLVWIFSPPESKQLAKLILSVIALITIWKQYQNLRTRRYKEG
jgi:accessory gene regulator protein AgrB